MKRAAWLFIALVGLAAPVGVVFATHALADTLGRDFGALAAGSVRFLQPQAELIAEAPAPAEPEPEPVSAEVLGAPVRGRRGPARSQGRPSTPATLGVRVSARQVLELARRRAIPQAVPVAAQGARPAGLRLTGLAGLGIGMKDGDVLTRVAGVPVTSVAAVADSVIRARAGQVSEISAEFWRDGARGTLVVEQPYVTPSSAGAPKSMSAAAPSTNAATP